MKPTVAKVVIDVASCTGCGACCRVCLVDSIKMQDGKAHFVGGLCFDCGHCRAVCPVEAIEVAAIDPGASAFSTFEADGRWLPYGEADVSAMVRFLASRRSCRNFLDRPLDRAILEDLVRIGITAPSATNSQLWTFTLLPDRASVTALIERVTACYRRLVKIAALPLLRQALRLCGKPELNHFYQHYREWIGSCIARWDGEGRDWLFHGAPAAIVVGGKTGGSHPDQDAMFASQNILLGAHAMGIGSCLVGLATSAMRQHRSICTSIGMDSDETPYAIIALGYPDEHYERLPGRKKAIVRICPSSS